MYIYIHTYMYIYIHTYMYIFIYIHTFIYICISRCMYVVSHDTDQSICGVLLLCRIASLSVTWRRKAKELDLLPRVLPPGRHARNGSKS